MPVRFNNLLVDPSALSAYLKIRREDVLYRWQDNSKLHTMNPERFYLDNHDRYIYFVHKQDLVSLQKPHSRRAKRYPDWPQLRLESRHNQKLPDWEYTLFPLPNS